MKNTFRILFAVVLALTMCLCGFALTLDNAEISAETNQNTEAELLTVSVATVPGKNLLTDTTEALDFETAVTMTNLFAWPTEHSNHVVSDAKAYSGTKSLAINVSAAEYYQSFFNVPAEAGRKYYFAGKTIATTGSASWMLWLGQRNDNNLSEKIEYNHANNQNGVWTSFEIPSYVPVSTNRFMLQLRNGDKASGQTVFFDDLLLVPYYKVTYIGLDGETVAATEYVLFDDNGDFLTKYIPDTAKVSGAAGYSLTPDGDIVHSVALNNEDIVLYAVETKVIPGRNLLTGTVEALDFETAVTMTNLFAWPTEHSNHVVSDAKAYSGTKSLAINVSAAEYYQSFFNVPVYTDRLYYFGGKTIATTGSASWMLWLGQRNDNNLSKKIEYSHTNNQNGVWTSFDITSYKPVSTNRFMLQLRNGDKASGQTVFFDDLLLVPYYKVTYIGLDGETVEATEYVLLDDNGNFLASYIPDITKVEGATDFALTPGGESVDAVALDNKDIVLFALNIDKVYFTDGNTTVSVVLDEETYTIPSAKELGIDAENFIGWTDGTDIFEVGESYNISDINQKTLTCMYLDTSKYKAPEMMNVTEIRGNGKNNGIRFKASVMPSIKANLDEFGFLATREVLLPYTDETKMTRDYSALTFLYKSPETNANCFVKGVAYDAEENIDVVNGDADDGSVIYTTVLTGIPLEKKKETMVVRSYAKANINGKEMTFYGNTAAASLYDVASKIANENGYAYQLNKAYIDSVLEDEKTMELKAEAMRPTPEEITSHTTLSLWHEGEVPFHLEEATNYATITPYIVEGSDEAVVIFPGGGYFQLIPNPPADSTEGTLVAKAYNEKGISAFVVTYRYKPYNGNAILADGQRAVQYVRYFAEDFGINPDKIAVLGFSAGGHLATMVCQHEPSDNLANDAIGEVSSKPDAVILGYAVTTLGDGTYYTMPGIFLGEENKENASLIAKYSYGNNIYAMPPAFIFYSTLDTLVNPEKNSVALANAMTAAGKTVEIHGYNDGTHGVGLGASYAEFSKWLEASCEFLANEFANDNN